MYYSHTILLTRHFRSLNWRIIIHHESQKIKKIKKILGKKVGPIKRSEMLRMLHFNCSAQKFFTSVFKWDKDIWYCIETYKMLCKHLIATKRINKKSFKESVHLFPIQRFAKIQHFPIKHPYISRIYYFLEKLLHLKNKK